MFFEAKVLKTMRIGEDKQRKKRLRGTGLERGNTREGLEM
jgi:hypothetical protein